MTETNAPKTVLIVDDEDMTRVLLKRIFDRMRVKNLEILMAEDGEEALDIAQKHRPELILLDVLLPKLNGYDVCQRLRHIPDYKPHVIILTARGSSTDRERAEAIGADEFMTKPFSPSRLQSQLSELWGIHQTT